MVSPVLAQAILNLKGPDILGSFNAGREQARKEQIRTLSGRALQEGGGDALNELKGVDPSIAITIANQIGARSKQDLDEFVRSAGIARRMLEQGQTAGALEFANQRLAVLQQQGRDTKQTQRIRDLLAGGQSDQALKELTGFDEALATAKTKTSEFERLVNRLPEEDRARALQIHAGLAPRAQTTTAPSDVRTLQRIRQLRATGRPEDAADAALLESSLRRESASEAGAKTQAREQKKQSVKLAKEAFDKLPAIRKTILNIDRAIAAIDRGASTGVIQSFLPSVREASIELDNLRGQMGLDVIGSTTFGALSEAELKFALDTALPTKLSGPALKEWLQRKRIVQKKVAEGIRKQARFFSGGGTIAELLKRDRDATPIASSASSDSPASATTGAATTGAAPAAQKIIQVDF